MTLATATHEARGMSWDDGVAVHVFTLTDDKDAGFYITSHRRLMYLENVQHVCTIRSYARMP